ncbi:hypothetical protein [Paenibacillus sp. MBLB4367]
MEAVLMEVGVVPKVVAEAVLTEAGEEVEATDLKDGESNSKFHELKSNEK